MAYTTKPSRVASLRPGRSGADAGSNVPYTRERGFEEMRSDNMRHRGTNTDGPSVHTRVPHSRAQQEEQAVPALVTQALPDRVPTVGRRSREHEALSLRSGFFFVAGKAKKV